MPSTTEHLYDLVTAGVHNGVYPGAVWAVGNADGVIDRGASGLLDPRRSDEPMKPDTVFDVASLTKILAVWTTIGTLWQDGHLDLDEPLGQFWPDVAGHPLGQVTAHQLLTHTAGLPLRAQLKNLYGTDTDAIRNGVLQEALHRPPGQAVEYTDRAALILGYLSEYLGGEQLDHLATDRVWGPLGMRETRYGPLPTNVAARCAPTELDDETGAHLKGIAHDFSARLLGGVSGIAGAFSTLDDLTVLLRYLLDPATAATPPGFGPAWTRESLTVHTGGLEPARGLFWHPAPGTDPADQTWTHYGFTGTAIWLNPKQNHWAVLLTNKLYYTRDREPLVRIRDQFRGIVFG
ncbi:serine hydrolase domain-containing protein [Promicromonospora soli]